MRHHLAALREIAQDLAREGDAKARVDGFVDHVATAARRGAVMEKAAHDLRFIAGNLDGEAAVMDMAFALKKAVDGCDPQYAPGREPGPFELDDDAGDDDLARKETLNR